MRRTPRHAVVLAALVGLTFGFLPGRVSAANDATAGESGTPDSSAQADPFVDAPADAPLEAYRRRLLDVAMAAVSKMPLEPHIKNRSRAQHEVAKAALQLDQPRVALRYMNRTDNWRRGAVAAEYMLYAARRGHTDQLDRYARIGRAAAKLATQDWRREYIHLKLVQARLVLGNREPAEEFNAYLKNETFIGRTAQIDAEQHDTGDEQSYDRLVDSLDQMIERDHYEIILNSAKAYVTLYDKNYGNASRRANLEEKLRQAYKNMPGPETIDLLIDLADVAVSHDDTEQARSFLDEADKLNSGIPWTPSREYGYEYAAKLAKARFRAGDAEAARALVDRSVARFEERKQDIFNLRRPDCLRPLAEAYQLIGAVEAARSLYARALEAGALNPNGRPQAVDLAKTCTSMALHAFEPDPALWDDIHRLRDQLSAPW